MDGKWFFPSVEGAMKEAGLTDVQTSINRRQKSVAQYIATRPLLDLCEGAKHREGARVTLRWRYQSGINWEKAKAKETETELASDSDSGSDTEGGGGAGNRNQGNRLKWGGMERGECG